MINEVSLAERSIDAVGRGVVHVDDSARQVDQSALVIGRAIIDNGNAVAAITAGGKGDRPRICQRRGEGEGAGADSELAIEARGAEQAHACDHGCDGAGINSQRLIKPVAIEIRKARDGYRAIVIAQVGVEGGIGHHGDGTLNRRARNGQRGETVDGDGCGLQCGAVLDLQPRRSRKSEGTRGDRMNAPKIRGIAHIEVDNI